MALWLTDEEFDELVEKMSGPVQEHIDNDRASGRRRRLLTTIVMPDDRGQTADGSPNP